MKKIMFNDRYGLTEAVLVGRKTHSRRIVKSEQEQPKYHVGEVVAIAQSYNDVLETYDYEQVKCFSNILSEKYKVAAPAEIAGYTNKMFVAADLMPHQIKITNVRIERLQDISDEDCLKEGILEGDLGSFYFHDCKTGKHTLKYSPCEAFAALIDKVSGKGIWDSNPYVFVYEFKLIIN